VFESFLDRPSLARRLLDLPRGVLAGPGAILFAVGLLVRWWLLARLAHPQGFIDFEGAFLAAVLGIGVLVLVFVGTVLVAADVALWVAARFVRR
jgi:hypothetical protein